MAEPARFLPMPSSQPPVPPAQPSGPTPLCIGHSHVACVTQACTFASDPTVTLNFWDLGNPIIDDEQGLRLRDEVARQVREHQGPVYSMMGGSAHTTLGLLLHPQPFDFVLPSDPELPLCEGARVLPVGTVRAVMRHHLDYYIKLMNIVAGLAAKPIGHLEPPPPHEDGERMTADIVWAMYPGMQQRVAPSAFRYKMWRSAHADPRAGVRRERRALRATTRAGRGRKGLPETRLLPRWRARQPRLWPTAAAADEAGRMKHPYENAPAYRRWRASVSNREAEAIDPCAHDDFRLRPEDRVMTAGSCFAQHISRYLKASGLPFVDTEPAHPILPPACVQAFGYGLYSARYGNIYTARQLLQLLRRARGQFQPLDEAWHEDGAWHDPFRPAVQPGGFASREELDIDRRQHLSATLAAFEQMDVLVFTLGLTECWHDMRDGAVYPTCPGTVAGTFDPSRHALVNVSVQEVVDDMQAFADELHAINPRARIVLTVSPVPLAATALDRHVLVSSTVSKAILRVACEMLGNHPRMHYFPAYEIVTCAGNDAFDADRRSVRESTVQQVMRVFFRHLLHRELPDTGPVDVPDADFTRRMQEVVDTLCEESRYDEPDGR